MALYPSTTSDRMEPPPEPEELDLCETCSHHVDLVDRAHSCAGRLRLLTACVASHDFEGEPEGEIITELVSHCALYAESA